MRKRSGWRRNWPVKLNRVATRLTYVVDGQSYDIAGGDFEALWDELGDAFFDAARRDPMSPLRP